MNLLAKNERNSENGRTTAEDFNSFSVLLQIDFIDSLWLQYTF